jgi:sec-independent protein translocase protein TatA
MSYMMTSLALAGFGIGEAVLVFGVLMLVFGAKKLPMLARGLGAGIRNFKGELEAPADAEDDERD